MTKDKDEQELADYLDGKSPLSREYRQQAQEQPGAAVDGAILAAARRAVGSKPVLAWSPFAAGWRVPLSLAAVVMLSVTLVITLQTGEPVYIPADVDTLPAMPASGGKRTVRDNDTGSYAENDVPAGAAAEAKSRDTAERESATVVEPEAVYRQVPAKKAGSDALIAPVEIRKERPAVTARAQQSQEFAAPPDLNRLARGESVLIGEVPKQETGARASMPMNNQMAESEEDRAAPLGAMVPPPVVADRAAGAAVTGRADPAPVNGTGVDTPQQKRLLRESVATDGITATTAVAEKSVAGLQDETRATAVPGLLQLLPGAWKGAAVITPVGPTPYDINFSRTATGCVSGTSFNGASNHHWTFCPDQDAVAITFLSDFRGNSKPIYMQQRERKGQTWSFKAESHPFMDVVVQAGSTEIRIDILHDNEQHVVIELNR